MILKRGTTNFLTMSPFTGANFGVNLTAGNLTVSGTFTPNGGILGYSTTSQVNTLLAAKQDTIADGRLAQVKVANLTNDLATLAQDLNGKQSALTSLLWVR